MAYTCWVIDDEVAAHKGIEIALRPYNEFTITQHFYSIDQVPKNCASEIDVIFLDVQMPRANGFTLFEKWRGRKPIVVLVTAYQQYALQAFENHVFDYLLKPIDDTRFEDVINRLKARLSEQRLCSTITKSLLSNNQMPSIKVNTDQGLQLILIKDIIYFQAVGDFVCVKLHDQELLTRSTLKAFISKLSIHGVVQIHRSFAINMLMMERLENASFGDALAYMRSGDTLRVSRRFKKQVIASLQSL